VENATNLLMDGSIMKQDNIVTSITTTKDSAAENSHLSDSTTKTLNIHGEPLQKLTVSQFVAFQTPIEQIREALVANLGESTMSVTDLERIKIPAGGGTAWTVPEIGGEEIVRELSGVILVWRDRRMYWKLPIEQSDGAMRPDCYASDARTGIGDPGGDCHSCRFSQFGSAAKGDGQACKLVRQLFLLRPGNLLPDIVNLPAGSLKPVRDYFKRLAAKGWPCFALITKIGLAKAKNSQGIEYSRAAFTAGDTLPPELAKRAREYATMLKSFIDASPTAPITKAPQPAEGEAV
jgi:hypothetical protein